MTQECVQQGAADGGAVAPTWWGQAAWIQGHLKYAYDK